MSLLEDNQTELMNRLRPLFNQPMLYLHGDLIDECVRRELSDPSAPMPMVTAIAAAKGIERAECIKRLTRNLRIWKHQLYAQVRAATRPEDLKPIWHLLRNRAP